MKKLLFLFLSLVIFSGWSVSAFFDPDIDSRAAYYAAEAPVIDGDIDEIWGTATAIHTLFEMDLDYAYGYAKVLWREDALYFLAVVYDTTLNSISANSTTNLVNFWVSETKSEENAYGVLPGDWYLPVNQAGHSYTYAGLSMEGRATYQAKVYPDLDGNPGYVVEAMVKTQTESHTYEEGQFIGFCISIDDDADGDNIRDSYCNTQGSGAYWSNPSVLVKMELRAAEVVCEHSFEELVREEAKVSDADCQQAAVYYTSCSACGELGEETFTHGESLGHEFKEYRSDGNATCTQAGTKTATCSRCEATDTVVDEQSLLPHSFVNGVCEACGAEELTSSEESDDTLMWGLILGAVVILATAAIVFTTCKKKRRKA